MKIISKVPTDKVMVVMTTHELANVMGNYSHYSDRQSQAVDKAIREEINLPISDIYKKHYLITSLVKQADYDRARRKLEDMVEAMTPVEDMLEKLSKAIKEEQK